MRMRAQCCQILRIVVFAISDIARPWLLVMYRTASLSKLGAACTCCRGTWETP